jgi:metal-responsive CopG/Arc/MetJ family transcriptional regulator
MSQDKMTITVIFPKSLLEELDRKAESEYMTRSAFLRRAVAAQVRPVVEARA